MSILSKEPSQLKNVGKYVFLAMVILSVSCAKTTPYPKTPEHPPVVDVHPEIYKAPPNGASQKLVNDAIELIDDEKYADAEWLLEEALKIDTHNGDIFYWLGYLKYKTGDLARAESFLDKADALAVDEEASLKIQSLRDLLPSGAIPGN